MTASLKCEIVPLHAVPGGNLRPERERKLVLVVDDEWVIADTLSVILAKSGYAVLTAYDGESALEWAQVAPPDLLLSDVMMGDGMDGTELAVEVLRGAPQCRIMLFSGHAATQDLLDRASDAGHSFTFLSKPLHPADLLAHIEASFATRRLAPIARREPLPDLTHFAGAFGD